MQCGRVVGCLDNVSNFLKCYRSPSNSNSFWHVSFKGLIERNYKVSNKSSLTLKLQVFENMVQHQETKKEWLAILESLNVLISNFDIIFLLKQRNILHKVVWIK